MKKSIFIAISLIGMLNVHAQQTNISPITAPTPPSLADINAIANQYQMNQIQLPTNVEFRNAQQNHNENPYPIRSIPVSQPQDPATVPKAEILNSNQPVQQNQVLNTQNTPILPVEQIVNTANNDNLVSIYNTRSISEGDEKWRDREIDFTKSFYAGNSTKAVANTYQDYLVVLEHWIILALNRGVEESKVVLELSRKTPEEFVAWAKRIQ